MGFFADQKIIHLAEVTRNIGKRGKQTKVFNFDQNYYQTILCTYHKRERFISVNKKKARFQNMFTNFLCLFEIQYLSASKMIKTH